MIRFFVIFVLLNSTQSPSWAYSDTLVNKRNTNEFDYCSPEMERMCFVEDVIEFALSYLGSPYRYSGTTPAGFDCSGFMNFVHGRFGFELGRSSRDIALQGEKIEFKHIQPGDFVVFRGRKSGTIGHVGLVIEKTPGSFKMIHSATSGGVRIDDYQAPYYKSRYVGARRIYPVQ
jgi:cell wall-associated NlpC family hydrolase